MADLIFYTNPMSRGRIARWMLEEVGQPYETVILDYGKGMKSPDYLAINPMGKVPAIRHGDAVVTEAAAICAYLADAFPKAKLAPPPTDKKRAAYYRWLFFTAGPFESALTAKALGLLAPPDKRSTVGYGSYAETVAAIESALTDRDFICGDQFTAADVYVGAQISWAVHFKTIPDRPAFADYAQRLRERPAYIRARDLDDAAMPKQEISA
jgi:glutathione S-transferase